MPLSRHQTFLELSACAMTLHTVVHAWSLAKEGSIRIAFVLAPRRRRRGAVALRNGTVVLAQRGDWWLFGF
jgi:hypothetical protein